MTKNHFLNELDRLLAKLPEDERRDILRDYDEHFANAQEVGKTDEAIIDSLGSPEKIAKELAAEYHVELARASGNLSDASSAVRAVVAAGGLGFFNLVFVLGPAMAVVATIFAIGLAGVAFVASPILLLVFTALRLQTFHWFDFFSSLTLAGIGIFVSIAAYYMSKWTVQLTTRYLAFNLRIIKGDKQS